MPLTGSVSFKVLLQKGNRVQVPKLVRWRFKLDSEQVLRVSVTAESLYGWEKFFGRMDRSGRITVPKLTLKLLREKVDEKSLVGTVLQVKLEPA